MAWVSERRVFRAGIISPMGQSAIPASFRCAQAKGMPIMKTASGIAVMRCPERRPLQFTRWC